MGTIITIDTGCSVCAPVTITITDTNEDIMSSLDDLAAAVAANNDRGDALIQLLQGVADKLDNLEIDDDRLKELTAEIREQASEMGAAVEANTGQDDADEPGEDIEPTTPDTGTSTLDPGTGNPVPDPVPSDAEGVAVDEDVTEPTTTEG